MSSFLTFKRLSPIGTAFLILIMVAILLFPALSHAALPANELWREDLVNHVVGFGKNTTGGKGGTLCQVTNLNDSGAGSLRACAESAGPTWITFTINGTINTATPMLIQSDKTVDGRGADVTLSGCASFEIGEWSLSLNNPVSNVIIENLKFQGNTLCNGFIIIAEHASNIWVDHNTFRDSIDEIIYVGSGAPGGQHTNPPYGITVSWNHMPNTTPGQGFGDKSFLVSDPTTNAQDINGTVTAHHNRYETYVRHPSMAWMKFHSFNNYLDKNETGMQCSGNGQLFSEDDIFEGFSGDAGNPKAQVLSGCTSLKVTTPYLVLGTETYQETNPGGMFDPHTLYPYTSDLANDALRTAIISGAGWQNVTAPTPSPSPIACSQYTPSSVIPTGFASPYDVVSSPNTNLMNVTCDVSSARIDLGKADPLQYIYNQGYLFKTGGSAWTPLSYTSTESLIAGAWYPKSVTTNISLTSTELANPSYHLAYICTWTGSSWKCGCRDSACTQSYWQIQSFKR